jgi:hypothetical protein
LHRGLFWIGGDPVSIDAPAREADDLAGRGAPQDCGFNPPRCARGDPCCQGRRVCRGAPRDRGFNPRPCARGDPCCQGRRVCRGAPRDRGFNPRPCARGDPCCQGRRVSVNGFNPRRCARGDRFTQCGRHIEPSHPGAGPCTASREGFAVKHPRWEPYAAKPLVRFCAGAPGNRRPYRDYSAIGGPAPCFLDGGSSM